MVRHTKKRFSKKRNLMKKMSKGGKKHRSYKKKTNKRREKKSKRKMTRRKKGGSSHVTTFVGAPYGPELKQLPGVSGSHDGNYYALNKYDVQPGRIISG